MAKTNFQQQIEQKLGKKVVIVPASDGCNLLYEAFADGERVAKIYRSFDANFKETTLITYPNRRIKLF